jgi:hypothetical protein
MKPLWIAAVSALLAGQPAAPPPAPKPALEGVIEALRTNQLVAISDPHGSGTSQTFIRSLIADPRFADLVDDIVVEIGNARYQPLVDDYVNGKAIDEPALAEAWLNTTVANQISADVEWFRIVRQINRARPPARRMRILLADPPIDWTKVHTREDHLKWLAQRDSFPAALIQTEVLAKERRALIVYGHLHYQRLNMMTNFVMDDWRTQTIVSLVERAGPTRVFTVWTLSEELTGAYPDAASWARPAFAAVRGTALGRIDFGRLYPKRPRLQLVDGKPKPVPIEAWTPLPVEEQLDAVLYFGPSAEDERLERSNEPCSRPGFLKERLRRITLTGIPRFEAEAIERLCSGGDGD